MRRARFASICADERQYVNAKGQSWTTLEELQCRSRQRAARARAGADRDRRRNPRSAIGQRALIIEPADGGVLWDCTPAHHRRRRSTAIEAKGGIKAIAISHPHFYSTMVDWSQALGGVPIYLHEDNRD